MSINSYEVELKTLLSTKENADVLLVKMKTLDPDLELIEVTKRFNDYFIKGDFSKLFKNLSEYLSIEDQNKLKDIVEKGKSHSVRTRKLDDKVLIIVKASIDNESSINGGSRIEFEGNVNLSLDELNKILLNSDFEIQARWYQERDEYKYKGVFVSISFSPGYGYVSEFEKIVSNSNKIEEAKAYIKSLMSELQIKEFDYELLQKMFEHYNKNWREFYGTRKTFSLN